MPQKVILVADPGIDTAFAIAIALHDPRLDVLGLLATAGNVSADQATSNVHILIDQLDPPKWPRLGAAPPDKYEIDGTALHGPDGLGGVTVACTKLHAPTQSDKLLVELPGGETGPCRFLRQIVPFGIRATANHYGVEGFHLNDVLGPFALVRPGALTTRALYVDVETQGELTRGMSVVDLRPTPAGRPNRSEERRV